MGTHRQHGIEHTRFSGEWVRALYGEQGRHRRYHAGVGQRAWPYGITVNAISPGLTRSPGTLARVPRPGMASMEDEYAHAASMQAIKRPEVPADLVGTVSFLTRDDAAFITGQTLNVDGGRIRT
jgi:NAD(P)-dependent dehydrogenase (short-subunit alcohol dehydrogenase family)